MSDICDRFSSEPYSLPRHREPEPFYAIAEPCESCGRPSEKRYWDAEYELWIGINCECVQPEEPVCPALGVLIVAARNVREIVQACQKHREGCPVCGEGLKPQPVRSEVTRVEAERPRKAA